MELRTFDEILTQLCDEFDSLISPRTIARTNTNVIYLLFKAIAKGFETVNNVCVSLNNKFNPLSCSLEDLESVAKLVGTERYKGSASGLYVKVNNTSDSSVVMQMGTYVYFLDDDTRFTFELASGVTFAANEMKTYIAFSDEIGSFPVTSQSSITVDREDGQEVPSELAFSCDDNAALLGVAPESDKDFRYRLNEDTTRQDSIGELQTQIKNLPYIFDCSLYFNNTLVTATYDGVEIPAYHLVILYSGEARQEIASLVAAKSIFPTVQTDTSIELQYNNDVFVDGHYSVYVTPFKEKEYTAQVTYSLDLTYADQITVENEMEAWLKSHMNSQVHTPYVKEADLYNSLVDMNPVGVTILNVDLYVSGSQVSYVDVPLSRIPVLKDVSFIKVV